MVLIWSIKIMGSISQGKNGKQILGDKCLFQKINRVIFHFIKKKTTGPKWSHLC